MAMALFMGVVLTACGSSSDSAGSAKYAATETAADYGVDEQPAMAEEMADYDMKMINSYRIQAGILCICAFGLVIVAVKTNKKD